MLKQHRVQQMERQLKLGEDWENRDLMFPDLHGGYFNPNYLLKVFKKILQEAGIPHMHFHDVRRFGDCKIALKGQKVRAITF